MGVGTAANEAVVESREVRDRVPAVGPHPLDERRLRDLSLIVRGSPEMMSGA